MSIIIYNYRRLIHTKYFGEPSSIPLIWQAQRERIQGGLETDDVPEAPPLFSGIKLSAYAKAGEVPSAVAAVPLPLHISTTYSLLLYE